MLFVLWFFNAIEFLINRFFVSIQNSTSNLLAKGLPEYHVQKKKKHRLWCSKQKSRRVFVSGRSKQKKIKKKKTKLKQWCGFAYRISCQIWRYVWSYFANGCFYSIWCILLLFVPAIRQKWKWFLCPGSSVTNFFQFYFVVFFSQIKNNSTHGTR